MTLTDEREAAFQETLKQQEPYFAAVEAAGDAPWFAEGNPKREAMLSKLGLPADISETDLRRAVFMRRYA